MSQPVFTSKMSRLFIDSGAHSMYTQVALRQGILATQLDKEAKKRVYAYYDTPEFWAYVDEYAAFIKETASIVDLYANVDAIFEPLISWKVQKYLENKHGLNPVPVIHHGTPMAWVKRYIDEGYDLLGIGGVGQEVRSTYVHWADELYDRYICPGPSKMPIVRTHGFAMTGWELLRRYPWWSVDSATWVKNGAFGAILVPKRKHGKADFSQKPFSIFVSATSPVATGGKTKDAVTGSRVRHLKFLTGRKLKIVHAWVDEVGIPWGKCDDEGNALEWGLLNNHGARADANLIFFQRMADSLPEWPWPFQINHYSGFVQ